MVVAPVFVSVVKANELPTPTVAPTGTAGSYELISPIGNISSIKDQDPAGLSGFINLLIKIAIAMAGAIAVVIIIVNGIQYMGTGSVWEKGESKAKMGTAIGGIILLLCSYIILYTINPDLVNIKIGIGKGTEQKWKKFDEAPTIKDDGTYSAPPSNSGSKGCAGGTIEGKAIKAGTDWPVAKQTTFINELKTKNIIVTSSSGNFCSKIGDLKCTGMFFNTATESIVRNKLTELQKKVGTPITITGGSECWLHTTHGPDDAIVDIHITNELNKFITRGTSFPGGNKRIDIPGIGNFMAEGNGGSGNNTGAHWHVKLQ